MNAFKKWSFFIACHLPFAVQLALTGNRGLGSFHYGDFASHNLYWGAGYLQSEWIPFISLLLSVGLIVVALKDRGMEPMERYFWSLAVLINLTIAAPIFYWMRIRIADSVEQA
jgi:hypothetical protein